MAMESLKMLMVVGTTVAGKVGTRQSDRAFDVTLFDVTLEIDYKQD
jgi:hypothetical protein